MESRFDFQAFNSGTPKINELPDLDPVLADLPSVETPENFSFIIDLSTPILFKPARTQSYKPAASLDSESPTATNFVLTSNGSLGYFISQTKTYCHVWYPQIYQFG